MTEVATTILIGDLLVRSEMATTRDMADAVPISLKTGLPIGRVLIGAGAITEAHLAQALLAQSLIRDSLLSIDLAIQALRIVAREGFNLEQALRIVGWQPEQFVSENRLGQLLLAAEVITPEELDTALRVFYTAGLPLARVLVARGVISNLVAYAALTSQQMLREGKLSREQAIQCVRAASASRGKIEEQYVNGYLRMQPSHNVRLGELLVLSEIVRAEDMMQAVEWAITRGETLGDVLVARGVIKDDELHRALEAQRLVTQGILDSAVAGEVLKKANFDRSSVAKAMGDDDLAIEGEPRKAAPAAETKRDFEAEWLAEAKASIKGARPRTDEETWVRQLSTRLLEKIEALYTRNAYLKGIIDKSKKDEQEKERLEIDSFKRTLEDAKEFDTFMELIDKLSARVETLSYQTGYLRSRLDTMSAHLEMIDKLREAEEDAANWRARATSAIQNPPAPFVLPRLEEEKAAASLVSTTVSVNSTLQNLKPVSATKTAPVAPKKKAAAAKKKPGKKR